MESPVHLGPSGEFEARYLAFLETIRHLRPRLHRYCSRMTGSVLDGEDVVQDALFHAYRKLDTFEEGRKVEPWLFRIAHNQCIDFLRRRRVRRGAEAEAVIEDAVAPVEATGQGVKRAIEHVVLALPPKERACVLLKDVFDYSLEEIAELVDSTVGGVKAALNRGRSKLATLTPALVSTRRSTEDDGTTQLLAMYVDRFDRRDWDGLRELISADAKVRVADRFTGPLGASPYFARYAHLAIDWRMALGVVDGEPVAIVLRRDEADWVPDSIARIERSGGRIVGVADYKHCPWIFAAAESLVIPSEARVCHSERRREAPESRNRNPAR